jgi:glutaredoxin-like YruB-family protein
MPKITIYTTPTCAYCHMAKNYFASKKIDFEAKDVTTDAAAYNELLEKSGQRGVPVIEINESIVIGFDRPSIDALLRREG